MDIETYQDLEAVATVDEPEDATFATIGAVYEDGVSLIFDGMEEATEKHYPCNSFVVFAAGDRVRILKDSGTYVVEYPVGAPRTAFVADSATEAEHAATASEAIHATNADNATHAANANYATSAGSANSASSASNASNASKATQATLAMRVSDGGSSTSYYVLLRYHSGYYWIKSSMTGNWSKITTTT